MTIKELDGFNHIGSSVYSCIFSVDDVPEEYINEAKEKDGDDYVAGCMVIHAYWDKTEWDLSYCLRYITNFGDDLEWPCELSNEDVEKMKKLIREELY